MLTKPVVLITSLVILTLTQLYALYAILWFGWLTVVPNANHGLARLYAERWELISIPVGLLWIACLIVLIRTRRRRPDLQFKQP